MSKLDNIKDLTSLRVLANECRDCDLEKTRTNIVFSDGLASAEIMLIGEAPGYWEDKEGSPFIGKAGQLLNNLLTQAGLSRNQLFICNTVQCRPPENRNPLPGELIACKGFLDKKIQLTKTKIIIAMGKFATEYVLQQKNIVMSKVRGKWYKYQDLDCMPVFHTAYALRNPEQEQVIVEDFKLIKAKLHDLKKLDIITR